MEYCTSCGNRLTGSRKFCTKCGAPVRQAAQPVPPAPEAPPPGFDYPAPETTSRTFESPAPVPPPRAFESLAQDAPPVSESPPSSGARLTSDSPRLDERPQAGSGPGQPPDGEWFRTEGRPWAAATGPRPGKPRSSAKILALAAGAVLLLAGGGLAAWLFLGDHVMSSASSPGASAGGGQAGSGTGAGQSQRASTSSPSSPSSPSSSVQTSPSSPDSVAIAPGVARQPAAAQVASFVQAYFTAINSHDYGQYTSLFEPQLQPTVGQFDSGYRGTSDSDATLTALSPTASGVAATVTFTSHQPADNSPTSTGCTDWDITLYLQASGNGYLIGFAPAGYHAHYAPC